MPRPDIENKIRRLAWDDVETKVVSDIHQKTDESVRAGVAFHMRQPLVELMWTGVLESTGLPPYNGIISDIGQQLERDRLL